MTNACDQLQEQLGDYWDWAEDAAERQAADAHLAHCAACSEQFRLWEESYALIRNLPESPEWDEENVTVQAINRNVMNRIYSEDHWLTPASRRSYAFSSSFRRRIAGLLAGLIAVFTCGLMYTLYEKFTNDSASGTGVMETASAMGVARELPGNLYVDVPVASLSDPFVLHVSPAMPEYWIGLSLLGVVMTLLILNWFTRVRS